MPYNLYINLINMNLHKIFIYADVFLFVFVLTWTVPCRVSAGLSVLILFTEKPSKRMQQAGGGGGELVVINNI